MIEMQPRVRRVSLGTQRGFTLLELIVVITIVGILATIAIPAMRNVPKKAREAVLKTDLLAMRDVIDQHLADKGHFPPSLEALVEEGYLRKIPRDPVTRSVETWVVEYDSPDEEFAPAETDFAEDGQPGIIDVHSGSDLLSTEGTPYSEW